MNRNHLLLSLAILAGCSNSDPGRTRTISGQLSTRSMLTLDNPAIIVTSGDGLRKVVRVSRTGQFEAQVPTGVSLQLGIATTLPSGTLRETSTIVWPSRTTIVQPGALIDLGTVHRRGEDPSARARENDSGGDDGDLCLLSPKADLPYDAKLPLGTTFRLTNAFFEKGAAPAQILSVTMSGGTWRLTELKNDTVFTVTQADCDHAGNRDTGRDRIEVTWKNFDGSTQTDHLDMRYCEAGTPPPSSAPMAAAGGSCGTVEVCDDSNQSEHECDRTVFEGVQTGGEIPPSNTCLGTPVPTPAPVPVGGAGSACTVSAHCAAGFGCFQSTCVSPIN